MLAVLREDNICFFFLSTINYKVGQKVTNSVEYGNSKTTTLLHSANCTRPLFQGRTGCGGRPSGWHDIVTCQHLVHSKLDYCNSLYHNLPNCQLNRLQQIQNSLARAVVMAPKSAHITPILKSLHWLKVNERIECKLLSLTKFLQLLNRAIFATLSLFNLLAVPAPHLLSLFLAPEPSP